MYIFLRHKNNFFSYNNNSNKYRMEKDFPKSTKNSTRNLRQVTESVKFYEIAVRNLQEQVTEARIMVKNKLGIFYKNVY